MRWLLIVLVVAQERDKLLGKVVSAHGKTNTTAASSLVVHFDRLKSGSATSQLDTAVTAVLSTPAVPQEEPPILASPEPQARPVDSPSTGVVGM
jgi:hypothetical protein